MSKNLIIKNAKTTNLEHKTFYIADGKFIDYIDEEDAEVIDATNMYAVEPFIDIHTHVYEHKTKLGINADKVGICQGVLSVVDAGSVGISYFDDFKNKVINKNETEVLYFLNVSKKGLVEGLSELADLSDLMTENELMNFIKQEGKGLVGLKVRMSSSVLKNNGVKPLLHARKLSDISGLPLMIHIGNAPPKLDSVLDILKKGDIITHCFHGKEGGIPYYPIEFKNAVKKGIHFDVGHGNSSFSYLTVDKVLDIEKINYSISTDIYNANYEKPVKSLMTTMSKFIPLGVSVEELVNKVTALPYEVLNLNKKIQIGKSANMTIFNLNKTNDILVDSEGYEIKINKYIEPFASIKNGKVVWCKNV